MSRLWMFSMLIHVNLGVDNRHNSLPTGL